MPEPRLLDFILVEDNEDHAVLIEKTLRSERIANVLKVFGDAESVLEYLGQEGAPHPQAILADINLPGMNGLELLKAIKSRPRLKNIPVVILSTSDAETDRLKAYEYTANSYLTKPLDFDKFRNMVRDMGLYWGVWNQPPA